MPRLILYAFSHCVLADMIHSEMKICCLRASIVKEIGGFVREISFVKAESNVRWLAGLFHFFSSTRCTTCLFSIKMCSAVVRNVGSIMMGSLVK